MSGQAFDFPDNSPIVDDSGRIPPAWSQAFTRWHKINLAAQESGPTSDRPDKGLWVGRRYFDTTLGRPVWVGSVNPTTWVDLGIEAPEFPEFWGGEGDGVANDAQAMQDAVAYDGTARFYGKTYKYNSVIAYGASSLFGQQDSELYGPGITLGTQYYDFDISSIHLRGTESNGETGLYGESIHRGVFSRVAITKYRSAGGAASQALRLVDSFCNAFIGARIQDNEYGALIEGGSNACAFFSCGFNDSDNHGALVRGSYGVMFYGCDFEFNNDGLVLSNEQGPGTFAAEPRNNGADGCYFEGNTRSHVYIGPEATGTVRHASVLNCYMVANATQYGIIVDHSDSALIGYNNIVGTYSQAKILLKADSRNTTILDFPRWDEIALDPNILTVEAGATVSDWTRQRGYDVPMTTDASGNAVADMVFSVPYESGQPPIEITFYTMDDSVTSAVPFIMSAMPDGLGGYLPDFSTGFRVRITGGPVSKALLFRWRAGA